MRRRGLLLSTVLGLGLMSQAFTASPASAAECVGLIDDGHGGTVPRACVSAGVNEQGYPFVTLSVIATEDPNGDPESTLLFKTWIQDGDDVPRTLSVGANVDGQAVTVGVDLSGDPGRTNVCVNSVDDPESPQCVFVGDLITSFGAP